MAMAAIVRSSAKKKEYLRIFSSSSSSSCVRQKDKNDAHFCVAQSCYASSSSSSYCFPSSSPCSRMNGFIPWSSPVLRDLTAHEILNEGSKTFSLAETSAGSGLYQRMYRSISTMRNPTLSPLLGGDKEQAVPSPLTMVPTPSVSEKTTPTTEPVKRAVQAVLKKIKESPKKVNLVASLVRGMRVEDALAQLSVLQKRAAKTVKRVVWNARSNATHNHGLNGDRLYVAEAFVGKGKYLKRISMHAKGRSGIMHHPSCRLTVVVKELNQDQESQIAKYQSMTFRERSKVKSKLFPHKLIEVTPQWSRRSKESSSSTTLESSSSTTLEA